jgi:methyl-accepting chemotaxis protein
MRNAFILCLGIAQLLAATLPAFSDSGPVLDPAGWRLSSPLGISKAVGPAFPVAAHDSAAKELVLTTSFSLPADWDGPLGIELYKNNMAIRVFVNDHYLDTIGRPGPAFFYQPYISRGVLVNHDLLRETNTLRLVAYNDTGDFKIRMLRFMGEEEYRGAQRLYDFLDVQLPRLCAVLLLFLALYSVFFFINYREKRESLYLACCAALFALYLLNVAVYDSSLPYLRLKAALYACFPLSMIFLFLFCRTFFGMKAGKNAMRAVGAVGLAFAAGYFFQGSSASLDSWHSIMLVYPFSAIAYGFVGAARGLRKGRSENLAILAGLVIAVAFSAYDTYYFVGDKTPFILLQGIGLMVLMFGIFYAFSQEIANTNKKVVLYSAEMERSKELRDALLLRIKGNTEKSEGSAALLEESIERVGALASQSAVNLDRINVSIRTQGEQVEANKERVKGIHDSLDRTAGMIERHEKLVDSTMGDMQELTESIRKTDKLVRASGQTIAKLNKVCLAANKEVAESSQSVNDLASYSKNIHEIVAAIGDLASQTNTLSINAAIEAARSGQMGRGFAVVASEIRSLATKSGENATSINAILSTMIGKIGNIQAQEERVSSRLTEMALENAAVERDISQVFEVLDRQLAINEAIRGVVADLVQTVREISAQAKSQQASGEDLQRSMDTLDRICDAIQSSSREQKACNDELAGSLRQLKGVSAENVAVIADLRELMG